MYRNGKEGSFIGVTIGSYGTLCSTKKSVPTFLYKFTLTYNSKSEAIKKIVQESFF